MLAAGLRPVYASGECEIDLGRRELRVVGSLAPIGGRAFEIVEILAESAGELVTKDQLMNRVWPGAIVNDNTLQMHISAVRKALGPHRTMLKTESGRGYRLLGTWTVRDQDPATVVVPQLLRAIEQTPTTNIPAVATALIGRSTAIQRLRDLVSAYRVVTLTGPGGIGKTALALEVASGLLGEFEGAACHVELASLSDPDLVPTAVASVIGLRLSSEEISAEAVARAVGETNLLLILDNCEHVIDAAVHCVEAFLRMCPRTTMLATSREPLGIAGESAYRLRPLDSPGPLSGLTAAEAELFPAVQLFVERAAAIVEDFALTDANAPFVAEICRRLDGLPLAIEFAAAWIEVLGLEGLATRLDDSLPLLRSRRRTAVPRHRTMRAVIDWSYRLLSEDEQQFFRTLGIFAGGFTVEAATVVVSNTRVDAIDRLADLVAKSLVVADVSGANPRFRLLDTTRAYALEKLDESGDRERRACRHTGYYRNLFERAEGEVAVRPAAEWLADYAREIDNLRAALDWAFSPVGDGSIGVALTAAAVALWMRLSLLEECRSRAERALAALGVGASRDARYEMKLHAAVAASLMYSRGAAEPETGLAYTRALEISESLDDAEYRLRSLWGLWVYHIASGRHRVALELAQRFYELAAERPDPNERPIGEGMIGVSRNHLGDLPSARRHLEHGLGYGTRDQASYIIRFHTDQRALLRGFLARVLWLQGFPEQAMRAAHSTVEDARAADHTISLCMALAYAACPLALWTGDLTTAEHYTTMLLDHSTRHALPRWHASGHSLQGLLVIQRGDVVTGLRLLRAGEAGAPVFFCRLIAFLMAEALSRAGRNAEGLAAIEEAIVHTERTEEHWAMAELVRVKGELLLLQDAPGAAAAAEDLFRQALDWARRQGALSWELRAAMSLARLLGKQGRSDDGLAILQPVYDRFTEGFNTTDLTSARALLGALGQN